jgi:hypothetical protein
MLVLYKFRRCKVVLGREVEGERPISANGKSRAYNLLFQALKQLQCVPGCVLSRSKRFKRLVSARIRRGKRLGYMMLVCEINRSKAQDSH